MTEYLFNPRYITPETADSIFAHMREPVSIRPIPMKYITREMIIMAIRKPNYTRPITYGDAPFTMLGAIPAKEEKV